MAAIMFSLSDSVKMEQEEKADEAAVQALVGGKGKKKRVVGYSEDIANRRSPIWTLKEDLKLCGRVIECGGLETKLSPAWFRLHFSPLPEELRERNVGALILRFNYLRDELMQNLARQAKEGKTEASWEWLEEKHLHTLSKDYYTYEQDLALCEMIVETGQVGKKVGQKWFRENMVGRIPILEGRNASGLYGRFSKRLAKKLAKAVMFSSGGQTAYKWLRELHGIVDPILDAQEEEMSNKMLNQIEVVGNPLLGPHRTERITDKIQPADRSRRSKRPAKYEDEFEMFIRSREVKKSKDYHLE
jgi:hypothetical protein